MQYEEAFKLRCKLRLKLQVTLKFKKSYQGTLVRRINGKRYGSIQFIAETSNK